MTAARREIDARILADARRIELRTRRRSKDAMFGRYRSAFRGTGLVLSELREYAPGDDVKHINWRASAKTGRIYVKSYEEERQLTVLPVVDCSRSLGFRERFQRAVEFAALAAAVAHQNNDRSGLCLFSNGIETYLPPSHARTQLRRIIAELISVEPATAETNLGLTLSSLRTTLKRSAVIFVISDFYAPPFTEELRLLSAHHDVNLVLVEDDTDLFQLELGIVEFEDSESGERIVLDLSKHSRRPSLEDRVKSLKHSAREAGAEFTVLKDDAASALTELMHKKVKRMR